MYIQLFAQTTALRPDVLHGNYSDVRYMYVDDFRVEQFFPSPYGARKYTVNEIRERVFNSCNHHGNPDLAHLWYSKGTGRSMSVLDIVLIDGVIYRCESAGWSEIDGRMETAANGGWQLIENEPLADWERELLANAPAPINVPPILVGLLKGIDPTHVTDEELLARVRNEMERRMRESGKLSKIQQIKEIRTAAKKLADVPANDWARPSISNNGIGENGYTRVHVSNPSHGLKYVKELVMELDRAGYELRRKTK